MLVSPNWPEWEGLLGTDLNIGRFSKPPKIRVVRGCFQGLSGCLGLPEVTSVAVFGGLLNLPALFALADFHVFSVIYAALSCTEITSLAVQSAPRMHQ